MFLFDEFERKDNSEFKPGESQFSYLNRSPKISEQRVRKILEDWFSRYADSDKKRLSANFRSKNDYNYHSAFFELFLHEILINLGCRIEVEKPREDSTGKIDFLVTDADEKQFYLEATVIIEDTFEQDILFQLKSKINKIKSDDFRFFYKTKGHPKSPLKGNVVQNGIAAYIQSLNADEIKKINSVLGLLGELEIEGYFIDNSQNKEIHQDEDKTIIKVVNGISLALKIKNMPSENKDLVMKYFNAKLNSLNITEIENLIKEGEINIFPTYVYKDKDSDFEIEFIPKIKDEREKNDFNIDLLYAQLPSNENVKVFVSKKEIKNSNPNDPFRQHYEPARHEYIKEKINSKRPSKYGNLELPYVVAVNVLKDWANHKDVITALYGEQKYGLIKNPQTGEVFPIQDTSHNGVFTSLKKDLEKQKCQNTRISGVLIAFGLRPNTLKSGNLRYYPNPFAQISCSSILNDLPQAIPEKTEGIQEIKIPGIKIRETEGRSISEIFNLPYGWPEDNRDLSAVIEENNTVF